MEEKNMTASDLNANTPKKSYWVPSGIDYTKFQLPKEGIPEQDRQEAMDELAEYVRNAQRFFMGYQATQQMNFKHLADYLNISLNNIGDSFSDPNWNKPTPPDGYFRANCKWMERAVLDYYAKLWNAKTPRLVDEDGVPEDEWKETYWGYVVSMGSTEGNLLALRSARDYLNGTRLQFDKKSAEQFLSLANDNNTCHQPTEVSLSYLDYQACIESETESNEFTPVLFYSSATHYSIKKISQIIHLKTFTQIGEKRYPNQCPINGGKWPEVAPANPDGSIDLDALEKLVEFFVAKKYPIAINFNYGTTWTAAYDDIGEACRRLIPILKKHGMYEREVKWDDGKPQKRNGFWFHTDGALGAGFVPFAKMFEKEQGTKVSSFPEFDFSLEIHSLAMSGHKWMGAPWPCGIYMTKNKFLISNDVPAYVGSLDSTLAGSRNAFSALLMWDYLAKNSYRAQATRAGVIMGLADYAHKELTALYGRERVSRAPGSLSILFPRPVQRLVKKYALASVKEQSHILIMRHVTKGLIDNLIRDLKQQDNAANEVSAPLEDMQEMLQQGW